MRKLGLLVALAWLAAACRTVPAPSEPPLARVVTLGGDGPRLGAGGLSDPFGVAVAADGAVFVTDGTGGRVFRIGTDGRTTRVAEGLDMPSAVAVLPDGALAVANTGASTIVRVDPATGAVTTLAGGGGELDAPVGVAAAPDGTVYVADTYNDRICAVAPGGAVRPLAGAGVPGREDGAAASARFDTPCGVAVAPDGAILVADTGNGLVRRVAADGSVATVATDFEEPIALAVRADGSLVVADAAGSCVRVCKAGATLRLAGGDWPGRPDGDLHAARFGRPTGVALSPGGEVVVADSTNGAVRAVVRADFDRGTTVADPVSRFDAAEVRAAVPPRWPYDPPDRPREVAATFGEVRRENGDDDVWLHNALDIPGPEGETVRAVFDERVTRPIAARGPGDRSEYLRLSVFSYVHIRVGRDAENRVLAGSPFEVLVDDAGAVARVRVRRGARIAAGQPVGTLNKVNHVHLSVGTPGGEINPLTVLALPGLRDTVAPTIEGVAVADDAGEVLGEATGARAAPIPAAGRVRVLVRAFDRNDANPQRRRLGLFRLGYELVGSGAGPQMTLTFEHLPVDPRGGRFAFAAGSRSWFTGPTVFVYEVTNWVRDGEAREGRLELTGLAPGAYTLRVFAEDASGNRTTRDVTVVVRSP
jgi:glucose/arabinose dehydrogenase